MGWVTFRHSHQIAKVNRIFLLGQSYPLLLFGSDTRAFVYNHRLNRFSEVFIAA